MTAAAATSPRGGPPSVPPRRPPHTSSLLNHATNAYCNPSTAAIPARHVRRVDRGDPMAWSGHDRTMRDENAGARSRNGVDAGAGYPFGVRSGIGRHLPRRTLPGSRRQGNAGQPVRPPAPRRRWPLLLRTGYSARCRSRRRQFELSRCPHRLALRRDIRWSRAAGPECRSARRRRTHPRGPRRACSRSLDKKTLPIAALSLTFPDRLIQYGIPGSANGSKPR